MPKARTTVGRSLLLPPELDQTLRVMAEHEHRSVHRQIIHLLTEAAQRFEAEHGTQPEQQKQPS
jgi:hypothetical protein